MLRRGITWILPALTSAFLISSGATAPQTSSSVVAKGVDYAQVDLIFRKNDCIFCHFDGKRTAAGLNLTDYSGLMSGGKDGVVIIPGRPDESRLIGMISGTLAVRMPPQGSPMDKKQVATVRAWIADGAKDSPYGTALVAYYSALKQSDWNKALSACDEIDRLRIPGVPTKQIATLSRFPVYWKNGDEMGWYRCAKQILDMPDFRRGFLSEIAWTLVDPHGTLKRRDPNLGMKAAKLAVENSQGKSGADLDTLAWAFFMKGDRANAQETERRAFTCRDAQGSLKTELEKNLKAFSG